MFYGQDLKKLAVERDADGGFILEYQLETKKKVTTAFKNLAVEQDADGGFTLDYQREGARFRPTEDLKELQVGQVADGGFTLDYQLEVGTEKKELISDGDIIKGVTIAKKSVSMEASPWIANWAATHRR